MGGRSRRRRGKAALPVTGQRYVRLRLPDGNLGKQVPVVLYPRYTTLLGGPSVDPIDVSVFRRVSVPRGGSMTLRLVESDDSDLVWDGRPRRHAPRRRPTSKRSSGKGTAPPSPQSGRGRRTRKRRP